MYISFDDGEHWQSFQLNLPATPVTDIKIAHKDLVLSTQGRSFWILDNLTPLHQLSAKATAGPAYLFTPREAIRTPARGGGGGLNPSALRYPQAGAAIDYELASTPSDELKMEILDSAGMAGRSVAP